tara:strand:- start:2908 stop:3102 length:195 start_codon:yes stop_codon:yes gene_type:complete
MDDKERVLTLASAARKAGIDPDDLRAMIIDGKLDAVETEGGQSTNKRKFTKASYRGKSDYRIRP